jgi:hypothetical protein
MTDLRSPARAKINLCLFVGPARSDRHHEVVTLMDSLDLCDDVTLEVGPRGLRADEVICPGVDGTNLAALALRAFRSRTGWDGPPVRLRIDKRIPVAGGMAGGSADAAAALRLAAMAAGFNDRPARSAAGSSSPRGRAAACDRCRSRWTTRRSSCRSTPSWPPATSTPRPTGSASRATRSASPGRSRACRRRSPPRPFSTTSTTTSRTPPARCARRSTTRSRRRSTPVPTRRSSPARAPPWSPCSSRSATASEQPRHTRRWWPTAGRPLRSSAAPPGRSGSRVIARVARRASAPCVTIRAS